jgi:hypothetical protein
MRIMDTQLQDDTAYKDLLHLVQTTLLKSFPEYRVTARALHERIHDIFSKCQSKSSYLTPIRLEYSSPKTEELAELPRDEGADVLPTTQQQLGEPSSAEKDISGNIIGESTSKAVDPQSSTEEYPRRGTGPNPLSCDEMEKLEGWIVQVLTNDKIKSRRLDEHREPASDSKVTVKVHIDMGEFLKWMRTDSSGVSLLEVVTVTGTPTTAVAHKAGWYLDSRWGRLGPALLDWLAGFIEGNVKGE